MRTIDRNSRIPVYVQLIDIITEQIEQGVLAENQRIPTERDLCEIYGISRSTVRQAVQELERDRVLTVMHGKGTFVSPKHYKQKLLSFYSFTEEMKKLGKSTFTKVLSFEQVLCDERTARKMNLQTEQAVYRFTRLRYADHEPVMLVTSCIPCDRFPGFCDDMVKDGASLYQNLIERYGVVFSSAQESLQAVGARKQEAERLHVAAGFPCMLIERLAFEKDKIIEYASGIIRGDRYQYDIVLNS